MVFTQIIESTEAAAKAIDKAFEVSPLVGFLVSMIIILIIAVIALYRDRNKVVELNMDMTKDSVKALTIVTESNHNITSMSKESVDEIRRLREAIIKSGCKYEKSV